MNNWTEEEMGFFFVFLRNVQFFLLVVSYSLTRTLAGIDVKVTELMDFEHE